MPLLLRASAISKSYDGVRALRDVSFDVRAGEVHALVGENGAGKSTLIKIITGAVLLDSGSIEIEGIDIGENSPAKAKQLGIAAIYQQPALFPNLSVAENLALRLEDLSGWKRVDWNERRKRTRSLLAEVGATIDPDAEAGGLSMPQQQLVEIACAIGAEAKIVIMDEPTASLSAREAEALFRCIARLRARSTGIVYISHRLEELPRIADRVTVLRDGCSIETRNMAEVDRPALIQMMVGRELSSVFPKREVSIGAVALEARGVGSREHFVHDVSFTVRSGEILGLAGLVGSGRTELAHILFGLTPADSGEILLDGSPRSIRSPEQAIALGLAYVPEDRTRHGVIPAMSIVQNTSLAALQSVSQGGLIKFAAERDLASGFAQRLGIKLSSLFAPVSSLSGGNQQKVALSRWLATAPRVLILDEPTQGIDVGAKAEVHRLIVDLASKGMAILMISSELPEILGMSDRVAVMNHGTIAAILERSEATQDRILSLSLETA